MSPRKHPSSVSRDRALPSHAADYYFSITPTTRHLYCAGGCVGVTYFFPYITYIPTKGPGQRGSPQINQK